LCKNFIWGDMKKDKGKGSNLCLGFRASYFNIYKENQLDAV